MLQSTDSKPEAPIKSSKTKKDILPSSVKKPKKKPVGKAQPPGRVGNIQSLLNAASLLESVGGTGVEVGTTSGRSKEHHRSTDIWNANLRSVCVCVCGVVKN